LSRENCVPVGQSALTDSSGNLGVAAAAGVTGLLIKYFGWRVAFVVPGLISILFGLLFAMFATVESAAPANKKAAARDHGGMSIAKLLLIMTIATTSGSMSFNFSTSSNFELLTSKFSLISQDPARIGVLLALVYGVASLTQLIVGNLIDRIALKPLFLGVVALQLAGLIAATGFDGWPFYAAQIFFMAAIFGAVPFTDAILVRFVDDAMRSRVSGMRLTIALGASSLAVWLIGPVVKQAGFAALLWVMVATSLLTLIVVNTLPASPSPRTRKQDDGDSGWR
jgi:predicted MFS family arabinose efflux permease